MRLKLETRLLRSLCSYDKKKNKKPKIRVRYIRFGNKSTPQKGSNMIRRTTGHEQHNRHKFFMWVITTGFVMSVFLYGYFRFQ